MHLALITKTPKRARTGRKADTQSPNGVTLSIRYRVLNKEYVATIALNFQPLLHYQDSLQFY